ncbi:glycosyltransferase [Clostridium sp. WILCCON 0269]|uniref:Glycosyltransferase n=1 Tax=Candidatus Clostridium eludens TaxID=3381663 RepID=A0ABW8SPN5_9CLOT
MYIKVSIIVPVYNTENYLPRCLESLINQSLEEIEIILINDCSTDHSLAILEKYKENYPSKITIINLKENKGPGGARNEGIRIAKGEYLGFVDSDDDVSHKMFEELYKIATTENYDMVDCQFYYEGFNQNIRTTSNNALGKLDLEKKRELFIHSGFIWSKIIKRNIIVDNNIRFREKTAYEDIDFIRVALFYFKKIYATDMVLYNYRNNANSISGSPSKDIQIYQKIDSMKSLCEKFKNLNAYNDYKDEITYLIYKSYVIMIYYVVSLKKEEMNPRLFKELRDFFFEVADCNYQNNKYILQINESDRSLVELNNRDYRQLICICSNLV